MEPEPGQPERPQPTRTTIVGGQPAPATRRTAPIPQGLESVLRYAAANPRWRKQLRQDPVRAAERARIPLSDNERLILAALPPEKLEGMIAGYETTRAERRGFLRQLWASAVGLLLGAPVLTGCHREDFPGPATDGMRQDRPPPRGDGPDRTKGIRPDVPEPKGDEERPEVTRGVRPDLAPKATGARPDLPPPRAGAAPPTGR